MARTILLGTTLAVLLSASLACSEAPEAVRMGTEGAYPPFNVINDDGEVDGFERELGDELCQRANLECTWVTNEWDTIIPNLVDGQYDTILAGMSITEERDEVIDFTQPYFPPSASVYLAVAGAGDEAVNGKVGAQVATVQAAYLADQAGATLLEYELASEPIAAVLSGEADAALVDIEFAHESMAEHEGIAGHRRPGSEARLRCRYRHSRRRWRVEGQAGRRHQRHESRRLTEHADHQVVRPRG